MNIKAFFVDALTAALDLNIGTPDDVLRHVTPDVLAKHLPRPLWARLLTACLGASRVDSRLVVETIGLPNLCEHVPASMIWACIAEIGARSIGKTSDVAAPAGSLKTTASGRAILAAPPDINNAPTATGAPVAVGPSIPPPTAGAQIADVISELEQSDDSRVNPLRGRSPTAQRFRQSNTSVSGRASLTGARRPQAVAPPAPTNLPRPSGRRGTEVSVEPEPPTAVETGEWASREIAVDDSQLVEWQTDVGSASPITGDDDFSDLGRKR
jgi:hypothetical protein